MDQWSDPVECQFTCSFEDGSYLLVVEHMQKVSPCHPKLKDSQVKGDV